MLQTAIQVILRLLKLSLSTISQESASSDLLNSSTKQRMKMSMRLTECTSVMSLCCKSILISQKLRNEALDGPLTIKKIDELRSMTRFYLEKGLPFVEVVVPEQPVSSGYIQILVTESRLGEIKTEGNQHFSDRSLISHISCEPGEKIHLPSLLNDLDWLNRNPFRRSEAVFTPAKIRARPISS